jgi:hypothetical protein
MADSVIAPPQVPLRLAPVEPRLAPLFCLALLVAACGLASFAFACATPFAAFAVVAAAMLPLRPAFFVVAAAWLVNQAIGFGVHGYPVDAHTIAWGGVIGAAALFATATAALVLHALPRAGNVVALVVAWVAAFAAYEIVLLAATPFLGGAGDFTAAIIGRLGMMSLIWLVGLVTVCDVASVVTSPRRHSLSS